MIVRTWRGAVRAEDTAAYDDYLRRTGLAEYAGTPGHLGTLALRRRSGDTTEYLLLTAWSSPEAIRRFAGDDPERAVFYPEDERYLVAADPRVNHFEPFYINGNTVLLPDPGGHVGESAVPRPQTPPVTDYHAKVERGWWWRGWIEYATGFALRRGTGADFR